MEIVKAVIGALVGILIFIVLPAAMIMFFWNAISGKKRAPSTDEDDEEDDDRKPAPHVCWKCGYDLRGASNRCPECGTINIDRREYFRRLTEEWPDNAISPRHPEPGECPESVTSTMDGIEAGMIRDQLVARGMACSIGTSTIAGDARRTRSVFYEIMVYANDVPFARAYLDKVKLIEQSQITNGEVAVPNEDSD